MSLQDKIAAVRLAFTLVEDYRGQLSPAAQLQALDLLTQDIDPILEF